MVPDPYAKLYTGCGTMCSITGNKPATDPKGYAMQESTTTGRGMLPAGTVTDHGVIVRRSDTAYLMAGGGWVSFDRVHGKPAPVAGLVPFADRSVYRPRAYCDLEHRGSDAEADRWCEMYHRPITGGAK